MARTNFSFQKRQKELAKKKKQEEKKQRKLEKKSRPDGETGPEVAAFEEGQPPEQNGAEPSGEDAEQPASEENA